jgi:hypothetical protein
MKLITDTKFFRNTEPAVVKGGYKTTTKSNNNKSYPLDGKLLLILDWNPTIEFVYSTHSIFAYANNTVEVTREEKRTEITNKEIIQQYLNRYKDKHIGKSPHDILACNPDEYSPEELFIERL